jgi:FAD/FMN-containing dehydrogenase
MSVQHLPPSRLTSAVAGKIVIPEHARFDEARRAWNLAIDQRPAAVALPESPQDVAAAVLFARELGLRVAAQGTATARDHSTRLRTRSC